MRLKQATGWFAAGDPMLDALHLLSDGAFKLFAYLALTADRQTGRQSFDSSDEGGTVRFAGSGKRDIHSDGLFSI